MSGTPCEVRHAAPLAGADSEDVFGTLLGLSPQRIEELRKAEIIK